MTQATLRPPQCPNCQQRSMDEYTHHDCPEGIPRAHHRHWVCDECDFEWVDLNVGRDSDT
jgi:transposase-like protein